MKRILFILFSLSMTMPLAHHLFADGFTIVRRVEDGDTIRLANGERIRYIGVNAPEISHNGGKPQPFADEAFIFNKRMVLNKQVKLEFDREKKDHFGRTLAYVFKSDGTFINGELISRGYAYYYPHNMNQKYGSYLLKKQREAMGIRAGMWGRLKGEEKGIGYVGSLKSKRFHRKSCKFGKKIGFKNRIHLKTKWEAFWQGFAPCKKCALFMMK